ncbi:MAG: hypothetical protein QOD92_4230 [Acidimicrobiaceae bacterium]
MAVVVALAGCGKPPNLDHDEQVAFARGCASLIERGLSNDAPPRNGRLGSDQLKLDEPSAFYSLLERLRGPSTFNLHDPKHSTDTARQPLDACKTESPLSSIFGSNPGTTTTTTSTTVPGR